jgi:N-acetylmuramoyl-L-alanine amidase
MMAFLLLSTICLHPRVVSCQISSGPLTVMVDPGHGGQDPGGKSPENILEKQVTLVLAGKLVQALRESGTANALMTRKDDYTISLDNRAGMANHRKADLFISLHVGNSFRPVPLGFTLYYWSPGTSAPADSSPSKVLWDQNQLPYWEESRRLASLIQGELLKALRWPSDGVLPADLYLLRRVQMPGVLLELGSLNHPGEAAELQKPQFQETVVRAVSEAVKQYWVSSKQ